MAHATIKPILFRLRNLVCALCAAVSVASCAPKSSEPEAEKTGIVNDLPTPSLQGLAMVARLPKPYNSGNADNGRVLFSECSGCHTLERDGSESNGPNLHGVFERRAALGKNYPYSEALRNSDFVWDVRHLDHWIFNPHEALPGTSMAYIGVRNNTKRYDILAYLIAVTEDGGGHKD
jgi:cytochrome c